MYTFKKENGINVARNANDRVVATAVYFDCADNFDMTVYAPNGEAIHTGYCDDLDEFRGIVEYYG